MNKSILTGFFLTICLSMYCQNKIHKKCGPEVYYKTRRFLQNDSLNQMPFDCIVHVYMKGWGTATFINDSTLITAKHVADKKNLSQISIYKNVFRNNKVENDIVYLSKKDFVVKTIPYDCHFISSDISFVVLTKSGKEKVKNIYTNHMEIADYKTLSPNETAKATLSGYPVDLAGTGINNTDILANKSTFFKDLLFDENCKMVGYKIFTCSGDSGAPLWIEVDGKCYVIAIHHGGPEPGTVFNDEERNSAALITDLVLNFLK